MLTVSGVVAAFSSFIILIGLSRGLERSWIDAVKDQGTDVMAVQKYKVDPLTATLNEGLAQTIARVQGVADVTGELIDMVELETGDIVLTAGWGDGGYLWRTQPMIEGRLPATGESDGAAIGQSLADALHKKVGDPIGLGDRTFKITGILGTGDMRSTRFIVVRLRVLQEILGKPGKVSMFAIQLAPPKDSEAVVGALSRAYPDLSFTISDQIVDNNRAVIVMRGLAWGISVVSMIMAVVLILNTLLTSLMEQTHEIAMLTAVGWPASRIVGMLALEGFFITVVGSALGTLGGLAGLDWLSKQPAVVGSLKPQMSASGVGEIVLATIVVGFIASCCAGGKAVRLNVSEALKAE